MTLLILVSHDEWADMESGRFNRIRHRLCIQTSEEKENCRNQRYSPLVETGFPVANGYHRRTKPLLQVSVRGHLFWHRNPMALVKSKSVTPARGTGCGVTIGHHNNLEPDGVPISCYGQVQMNMHSRCTCKCTHTQMCIYCK